MPSMPLRLSALLAVLVLLLAACDSGSTEEGGGDEDGNGEAVAVVNGEDIPAEDLDTRFSAMSENPQFSQQLEQDDSGAMEKQLKAQILNQMIQVELLRQGAEELGVEASDEDIAEQRAQIEQQLEQQGTDLQTAMEQQGLSEEDLQEELETAALQKAVVAELTSDDEVTDDEVAQYFEDNPKEFETAKARQIVTETEEEAQQALERVEGDEDFAAVAEDVSIDDRTASEGGDLGEVSRSDLQMQPKLAEAIFETAEPGELVGPIETQQGWHVVEVTERSKEKLADVEGQIRQDLISQAENEALSQWLEEQVQAADVEVVADFAEWDGEQGRVVANVEGQGGMLPGQGQGQGGQGQGQGGQGQGGQGESESSEGNGEDAEGDPGESGDGESDDGEDG